MAEFVIDLERDRGLFFRIGSFTVPDAARGAFVAAMVRNMAFIRSLDGFRGHVVFEKTDGDSAYSIVTIAAWEDRGALEAAKSKVRAYYERIGFDMAGAMKRWGVVLVRGDYEAPSGPQQ